MLIKWEIKIIDETLKKNRKNNSFRITLNFIKNNHYSKWRAKKNYFE